MDKGEELVDLSNPLTLLIVLTSGTVQLIGRTSGVSWSSGSLGMLPRISILSFSPLPAAYKLLFSPLIVHTVCKGVLGGHRPVCRSILGVSRNLLYRSEVPPFQSVPRLPLSDGMGSGLCFVSVIATSNVFPQQLVFASDCKR